MVSVYMLCMIYTYIVLVFVLVFVFVYNSIVFVVTGKLTKFDIVKTLCMHNVSVIKLLSLLLFIHFCLNVLVLLLL